MVGVACETGLRGGALRYPVNGRCPLVYDLNPDGSGLGQTIVDGIGLTLPFSPLCTPDCLGLCPDCGIRLVEAEPDHHHDKIDPRWAKLAAMRPADAPDSPGDDS